MKFVGIDIGSFSIKIAEIDTLSKGYEITRMQEFPLSQDPNRDRKIEVIDLLRNLFGDYNRETSRFILGLRQNHVSSRIKTFPFRERHKIVKSLAFELEDELPFSPDEAIFEAKITKYLGAQAEVFAMAAPKERIIDLISLSSDCDLDPDIISVEGLAIANLTEPFLAAPREMSAAVETPLPEAKSGQILLNIGHDHCVFITLEEGTIKLIRHIDWGGKHLAEAISKQYSMHYLEALKELQRKGFLLLNDDEATKDQILFSNCLKAAFEPLIQELRLSLLEIKADYQIAFNEILLTGGVAGLSNLTAFLTQKLEVSTNRFSQVLAFPNLNFETNSSKEMSCVVAVGLAIEGLRRPKNPPIQFLRNEFAKQSQTFQVFWEKWAHTAQILAAALVFLFVYSYFKDDFASTAADTAQTQLKTQAAAVANLKGPKASIKAIKDFIKSKEDEEKTRELTEKIQDVIPALDIINRVSQTVPSRRNLSLEVTQMTLQGDYAQFAGHVSNQRELDSLRSTLANLSMDGKVETLKSPTYPGRVGFSYRIRVARTKGG